MKKKKIPPILLFFIFFFYEKKKVYMIISSPRMKYVQHTLPRGILFFFRCGKKNNKYWIGEKKNTEGFSSKGNKMTNV